MRPRGSGMTASSSQRRHATLSDSGLLSRLAPEGLHVDRTRRACRASPGMEKDGALVSIECDGEARLVIQIIRLQSQKQTPSVFFPITLPTYRIDKVLYYKLVKIIVLFFLAIFRINQKEISLPCQKTFLFRNLFEGSYVSKLIQHYANSESRG